MLAYLACAVVSMAVHHAGFAKLVGIAELVALAIVTADLAPTLRPAIARTVTLTTLAIVVLALVGLVLFYAGFSTPLIGTYGDLPPGPYARVEATFRHPNLFASWLVFAAALAERRWARIVFAIAIVPTFSRSIVSFALAALIRHCRSRKLIVVAAAGAALLIVALTAFGPSPRRQAIASALTTVAAHPLTGVGPDAHPAFVNQRGDWTPFDAHLTPLDIAATLGLPALVAFAGIVVLLWRQRPRDHALWSAMAAFALDALASDIEDFRHLWVLFGLTSASDESNESKRSV